MQGQIQTYGGPWAALNSGAVEVHPNKRLQEIYGGPWAALNSRAVEVHPNKRLQEICGGPLAVEALPSWWTH